MMQILNAPVTATPRHNVTHQSYTSDNSCRVNGNPKQAIHLEGHFNAEK
jgi:hypothetical protein